MKRLFSRLLNRPGKPIERPPAKQKLATAHEVALRYAESLRRHITNTEAAPDRIAVKEEPASPEREVRSQRRNKPVQQDRIEKRAKVEGEDSQARGRRAKVRQRRKSISSSSEERSGAVEQRNSIGTSVPATADRTTSATTSAKGDQRRAPLPTRKYRPRANTDSHASQTETKDITTARLRRPGKGSLHRL